MLGPPVRVCLPLVGPQSVQDVPHHLLWAGPGEVARVRPGSVSLNDPLYLRCPATVAGQLDELLVITGDQSERAIHLEKHCYLMDWSIKENPSPLFGVNH